MGDLLPRYNLEDIKKGEKPKYENGEIRDVNGKIISTEPDPRSFKRWVKGFEPYYGFSSNSSEPPHK